jgi:hypothetical protein
MTSTKAMDGFTPEGIPTYMTQTPDAQVMTPQDSATLPMFNPTQGFNDNANMETVGDQSGTK